MLPADHCVLEVVYMVRVSLKLLMQRTRRSVDQDATASANAPPPQTHVLVTLR
jgi:hypothetical protein